jgi:hypothetical protein
MAVANLALRFLVELGGFAAIGYSAYHAVGAGAGALRWLAGAGAALAIIILWAMVVAPKTQNGLSQPQKDVIGTVILLASAGALAWAGQVPLAIGFVVVVIVNAVLLFVFGADARDQFARMRP